MTKIKPNVVRGGKATNIGGNLYYMNGRKHFQGGIDIGKNPKTGLEVEDGEIVEIRPDSLRVFSAQPIINGNSPAKLVMGGANPDKVFQAQETFKDVNGINDDGSKKRMGGKVKIRRRINTEIDEELGLVPNKNRKAAGGFVTVNGNVIDKLVGDVPFPSPTGGRKKAALSTDKRDKDYVVMNGKLHQVTNDIIGLGANLAGTIASGINTRKALNKMEAPPQPNPVIASNLKTDFNISPQLGEIEENARRMVTDINANTSSSRTRLQRLQRTRNQAQTSKNSLRGQKENIETQLINQDRLNKQGVRATNVAAMNDWQNRSAAFRNSIREQKASSLNNVFSGINAGLQDMLSRIENLRNYNNTLGIYDATHPNVDRRLFTSKGVTF